MILQSKILYFENFEVITNYADHHIIGLSKDLAKPKPYIVCTLDNNGNPRHEMNFEKCEEAEQEFACRSFPWYKPQTL